MYFTDRGIEELQARRGDEEVSLAWLAERLRDFVNLNPDFEVAVDRLATFLARADEDDLSGITTSVLPALAPAPIGWLWQRAGYMRCVATTIRPRVSA